MLKSRRPHQSRPIAGDLSGLAKAFLEPSSRGEYSRVMEGIGRVSVALSNAEFMLDTLEWHLTGETLVTYLKNTKRKSVFAKIQDVKDLCHRIADANLKQLTKTFCEELDALLYKRNDAVHSLYGVREGKVIRIKLRAKPCEILKEVTYEALHDVEMEILSVTARISPFVDQVAPTDGSADPA